jgi:hypothetical protein
MPVQNPQHNRSGKSVSLSAVCAAGCHFLKRFRAAEKPPGGTISMQHSIRPGICAIALLAFFTPALVGAQGTEPKAGSLLIRGGWLLDGISNIRRPSSGIVIRENKIVALDVATDQQEFTPAQL